MWVVLIPYQTLSVTIFGHTVESEHFKKAHNFCLNADFYKQKVVEPLTFLKSFPV